MKVISLLQPWATLVVIGAKKIETRSWDTKYRGEILIHASASKKQANKIIWQYPFNKVLTEHFNHVREPDINDLPFGAIIGKVNIRTSMIMAGLHEQCRTGQKDGIYFQEWGAKLTEQEIAFGDYDGVRYGWLLSDPVQFIKPIPTKGSLGIWNYDVEKIAIQ